MQINKEIVISIGKWYHNGRNGTHYAERMVTNFNGYTVWYRPVWGNKNTSWTEGRQRTCTTEEFREWAKGEVEHGADQ